MDFFIAFGIFMIMVIGCVAAGHSVIFALLTGLLAFSAVAVRRGHAPGKVVRMAGKGVREGLIVIEILFMIGFMTGLWRSSGTITFFVYHGVNMITPQLFVLLTFVLSAVLGYILANSFATVGTIGLMMIAIAGSGGVDLAMTAGAVISGAYFGDRSSPLSSAAILVAAITDTKLMHMVKQMSLTNILPIAICLALYGVLSVRNPIGSVDPAVFDGMRSDFVLSAACLVPVGVILILLLLRLDVRWAYVGGIVSSGAVTVLCQGDSLGQTAKWALFGFTPDSPALQGVISGGGLVEMGDVCIIVGIACAMSGVFRGTDMLAQIHGLVGKVIARIGAFPASFLISTTAAAMFCSQTIAIMMSKDLLEGPYRSFGREGDELAQDICNSCLVTSAFIPWNVACAVPVAMLGAGKGAILYSFYLFALPLTYALTKRIWFRKF